MVCSSCGHDSPGARFCVSCGARLPACCGSCGAELPAGARFCGDCGSPVGAAQVPAKARKVVTAVFGDLVGSTALQEALDPESAQRVMARFYAAMRGVIARHGGHLDKFVGDGVVAVFGVPSVAEDDALRAVRCAGDMVAELAELGEELQRGWGVRLRMRTGVNTGELVVSGEGELVGDVMNTAARLEAAAAPGEVLVGADTWRLVRGGVQLEPVPPLVLKGKADRVPAWRVLSWEPAAQSPRAESPLVGRADELARLRGVLDEARRERGCRLVTVIGSPGMGKSRLAAEFTLAVGQEAAVVLGRCEPSGEGITFGPVAELLRAAAGIGDADPPEAVQAKLSALVVGEADAERITARAGSLLGVADPASVQETFWGVRRVLEALARNRPLIVVLEDLHWGQPLLLDLVEHLAEWVRDVPMLLLVLSRPELRETREALTAPGRRVAAVIELAPLAARESRALVDGVLGRTELPADLLDRILDTTDGNPLFLGETLRMLIDDGSLTKQGAVWVTTGADTVMVPPTIHALLSARIERLRGEERAVVERASVIGKQFYRGAVAELVAPPVAAGLDGHLETLRRKEMVEPDGTYWVDEPVFRFHHVLLRDAAYRSLLKEARAELHERFADWLQTKAGELVGEHEEVIAFHLEQAHEYRRQLGALDDAGRALGERAAAMLASAGRRALARADLAAAANLLGRSCARTETEDPELLWDWAEALLSAGDAADLGAVGEVVDRLTATGRAGRAEVLAGQVAILTGAQPPETLLERLAAGAAALAEAGDHVGATLAHRLAAQALGWLGRLGAAEAELDKALVEARRAGDRRRITAALAAAPRTALWGPSPVVRSSGRCLDVLRILRMNPGNRHVEAAALRCQAVLEAVRGRFTPAREILDSARVTLRELGLSAELHELGDYAGMIELLAGDPVAAETHCRAAYDGFTALGVGPGSAQAAALLARALVEQGRDQEAIEQTRFAEEHAGGYLKTIITALGARAEALARAGDAAEAVELARRAVTLAEPTDALPDKADAAMALARVLRTLGRGDESRAAASQARELYQAKDHTIGVTRATELAGAAVVAPQQAGPEPQAPAWVLGERPPERVVAEWFRRRERRDVDSLVALFAPDIVRVDHREVGWDDIHGRDALREHYRSWMPWPDVHDTPEEVLACDDRVIAFTFTFRGTSTEAGARCEIPIGVVAAIEDGLITGWDQYDPDGRQSMIARYVEVGGGQSALGDRPPERAYRELARWSASAQSLDDLYARFWDDGLVVVDHRQLGWSETDREGHRREMSSIIRAALDVRHEPDEVLACDDRVLALVNAFRGHSADGGGVFEIAYGMVILVEEGAVTRVERFEPDDRAGMLARYAELGGHRDVLGERPPERVMAEVVRRWHARDLDQIVALFAEDIVRIDHRRLGWDDVRGRAELRENIRASLREWLDLRAEFDEVLACDDRVIAICGAIRGTAGQGGGAYEIAICGVALVEDGLITRWDQYEADDRQTMIARYVELGGGMGPLGDRPPERVLREISRLLARQEIDALFEQLGGEDLVLVDHRRLGWTEVDKSGHRQLIRSMLDAALDVRLELYEVLACDDRFIAALHAFRGHSVDGGGEFEIATGSVVEVVDGRFRRLERFEYDDREALLARYAELGGHREVLGDRVPERVVAEYVRRYNARDFDQIIALFDTDIACVDHRRLGWEEMRGLDGLREQHRSQIEFSPDVRLDVGEVLACDDRAIAVLVGARGTATQGGGSWELVFGLVALIEHGLFICIDFYEPEDRQSMIARYGELGGGQGPLGDRLPERVVREFTRRYNEQDLGRALELLSDEDSVLVDHRELGWAEPDKAGYRRIIQSLFDAVLDARTEVDEVLACDDRVIAMVQSLRGHLADGGGTYEIPSGQVALIEEGKIRQLHRFEPGDRAGMLARYAELGGRSAVLGDSPAERVAARLCRRWTAADMEMLIGLFSDDVVRVDHRTLGYDEAHGKGGLRATYAAMLGVSSEVQIDPREVLARDDRVLVLLATLRGTAVEGGGEHATPCGYLFVVADDRIQRLEQFEPGDRQAMLARFAELGGGLGPLGDRPPERSAREWCRRLATGEPGRLAELYASDFRRVDHRVLAWEETGQGDQRGFYESFFATGCELWARIVEVLACDDRVIALSWVLHGRHRDGGGAFEIPIDDVMVVENGLLHSTDFYDPGGRDAMLARFAELTGPGESAPPA